MCIDILILRQLNQELSQAITRQNWLTVTKVSLALHNAIKDIIDVPEPVPIRASVPLPATAEFDNRGSVNELRVNITQYNEYEELR